MQYAILIYDNEATLDAAPADMMQAYNLYTKALIDAGVMRGGHELKRVKTATSVQVRNGKVQMTDGPFAETREQLGGLYVIETPSLEEALDWAAKCPSAHIGTIEVRPLQQTPAPVPA